MLCFSALSLAKYVLLPILRAFAKNYLNCYTHGFGIYRYPAWLSFI